jgi:hypothetical protein
MEFLGEDLWSEDDATSFTGHRERDEDRPAPTFLPHDQRTFPPDRVN